MKIELVSYRNKLKAKKRLELTREIINSSKSDILLFSGSTIKSAEHLEKLKHQIVNNHTKAIFEVESLNSKFFSNCMFHIVDGSILNLFTNQIFSSVDSIKGNHELANRFLHELETNRRLKINGKNITILQCGEILILEYCKSEDKGVKFRFSNDADLNIRFEKILSDTDIFLNPIHTPMARQWQMEKRRQFLSSNNRFYFSTSNSIKDSKNLKVKSMQYALSNGNHLLSEDPIEDTYSIRRIFEI